MKQILKQIGSVLNRLQELGERTRGLLQNPQENAQELVMLFGILIVVLLLVAVFAWFIFSLPRLYRQYKEEAKAPPKKKPPLSRRQKVIRGIVVLFFLVLIVAPLVYGLDYISRPSFCNQCHLIKKYYQSWKKSTHKNMGCFACHQEPGAIGFIVQRIRTLRNLHVFWFKIYSKPISAQVSNSSCQRCHKKIYSETTIGRGLRISHKEILAGGYRCVDCHQNIAHEEVISPPQPLSMNMCISCHNGTTASAKCNLCHFDVLSSDTERLDSYDKVEINMRGTCRSCHPKFTEAQLDQFLKPPVRKEED